MDEDAQFPIIPSILDDDSEESAALLKGVNDTISQDYSDKTEALARMAAQLGIIYRTVTDLNCEIFH